MTSKNSYSKPGDWCSLFLIKDCCKRTLWAQALYFVALFFALPVAAVLSIQNLRLDAASYRPGDFDLIAKLKNLFAFLFGTGNFFIGMIFTITAFVSALTVFYYLHKRKRVDFFHSLPIRRETLFFSHYIAGLLFIAIPYFINLILAIVVVLTFGYGNYLSIMALVLAAFQHLLMYILIYSLGILVAMLTGNLIVHGLLYTFLLAAGPALVAIYQGIMTLFYDTYFTNEKRLVDLLSNTSPLSKYIEMLTTNYLSGKEIVLVIFAAVALTALALLLYKKRPSDSAEQALSFPKTKPLFQYLITFIIGVLMGFPFYDLGQNSVPWMFFGIICCGVVTHRIIEIVYAFDFHAIRKGLLPMFIFLAIVCGLFVIPIYDLTGFNDKLPAREEIVAIKLHPYTIKDYTTDADETFTITDNWLLTEEENVDACYRIAQAANKLHIGFGPGMSEYRTDRANRTDVIMAYRLKNGKEIYRSYSDIPVRAIQDDLAVVLTSQEFQEKLYKIYQEPPENVIFTTLQSYEDNRAQIEIDEKLTKETTAKLITALKADMADMTAEQLSSQLPIACLNCKITLTPLAERPGTKPYYLNYFGQSNRLRVFVFPIYQIYPCYKQTLALLEDLGYLTQPNIENITHIVEYRTDTTPNTENSEASTDTEAISSATTEEISAAQEVSRTITDKTEIKKILTTTYPQEAFSNHPFLQEDSSLTYRVFYKQSAQNEDTITSQVRSPIKK